MYPLSLALMAMQYYRKPLLARATTSQPIISERDINIMFYRVEDLYELHLKLSEKLEPSLENWSTKTCVSGFFVQLVSLGRFRMGDIRRKGGRGERKREREREAGVVTDRVYQSVDYPMSCIT